VEDFGWDHLAVPARSSGALWIWLAGDSHTLPEGRSARRVWVFLSPRSPLRLGTWLYAGQDDHLLRRVFGGQQGEGVETFSHAVDGRSVELCDSNVERDWRWLYALLEDDTGRRHPFAQTRAWAAAGYDAPERFVRKPSERALVLPAESR
jgi:hypothetical protein